MGYVDANLVPGEFVAYRARLHWTVVAPALLMGAALDLIGAGMALYAVLKRVPGAPLSVPMLVAAAALMLFGSGWMAAGIIVWKATEITVTSRRVLIKTGVLSRHTTEILLAKVESVSIEESLVARMLGFGKVTIHGTGGTPETFTRISRPHEFRRRVQMQIEALPGPGMASAR
jgi:uncharacterized membrane protein YdbT with pleckstrin-like domain